MKARLLRKLLNDTPYTISDHAEYIAVGSSLCHNLIAVDKNTLKVTYAFDTFRKGRGSIQSERLGAIWDKLHELIATGDMVHIMVGRDELDVELPVYTTEGGELVETVTDEYGWPNTTIDGQIMYENTHFATPNEAIDEGMKDKCAGIENCREIIQETRDRLAQHVERLNRLTNELADLGSLRSAISLEAEKKGSRR